MARFDSTPPLCWNCGKYGVLPSIEEDAPQNELACVLCGCYFIGTREEVAQARRAVGARRDALERTLSNA
jgi:hypothetical protein